MPFLLFTRIIFKDKEEIWASLKYFEFDRSYGDTFQAYSMRVHVDVVSMDRRNDVFELGSITNIERNDITRTVRADIADGKKKISGTGPFQHNF